MGVITDLFLSVLVLIWIWDNRRLRQRIDVLEGIAEKIAFAADVMAQAYLREQEAKRGQT